MTPKNYLDMSDKVLLATVLERLDNLVDHFERHINDDEKVADRVSVLENKEARLDGRILALSSLCTIAGFVIGKLPIKWF